MCFLYCVIKAWTPYLSFRVSVVSPPHKSKRQEEPLSGHLCSHSIHHFHATKGWIFSKIRSHYTQKKIPFEQEVSSNPEVRGKRKKRSFTWIILNSNLRWGHIIKVNISPTECVVLWWFPQHLFFFFFFFKSKGTSLIHSPEFQFLNVLEFTQEVMLMIDTPFMTSAGSITGCLLLDAVTFGFIYIYIPIYINGVGWYGCQVYCNIFVGGCHSWHSYILTLFFFFF